MLEWKKCLKVGNLSEKRNLIIIDEILNIFLQGKVANKMTFRTPEQMLKNTFGSAILYAKEVLEGEDYHIELKELANNFLQQAVALNEVEIKKKQGR